MQFTALNTLAFADVPPGDMSGANTLFSAVQQMALGLGIALGAVVLRLGQSFHGEVGVPTLEDFRLAFLVVAVIYWIMVEALSVGQRWMERRLGKAVAR